MPVQLAKKSIDLDGDQEKFDQFKSSSGGFQFQNGSFKKSALYIMGGFLISLIVLIQNLSLMNDQTNPQFIISLRQGNNESMVMLSYMRESLKLATFFAQDFSFAEYADMDSIDTFDIGNEYHFYYDGYHKSNNHSDYFVPFNGLDVFGSMVKDIGVQLSNVSKTEDPDKLMESLLSTYSFTINNIEEMYVDYKKTGVMARHFDKGKLKMGHQAYKMENYGKVMKNYPVISLVVSLIACMALLLLTNLVFFKTVGQRTLLTVAILQFGQVIVYFSNYASQLHVYHKLNSSFDKINIAEIHVGSGYRLLQSSLLFTIIVEGILIYMVYNSKRNQ